MSRRRLRRRGGTRRGTAQGNFDAAIRDYTAAIRIDGAHFKAYYNRAFAYSKVGLHARAVEGYTDALRIDPSSANAHHNRGALSAHSVVRALATRPKRERPKWERRKWERPKWETAHRWRRCGSASRAGSALEKLDDDAAAIADFTKAIELTSANASAYAPNPAYGESRLRRIPVTANLSYSESRLW